MIQCVYLGPRRAPQFVELKSGKSPITQEDLELVVGLEEQVRHLSMLLARRRRDIQHRLIVGAGVTGGRHSARISKECFYRLKVS